MHVYTASIEGDFFLSQRKKSTKMTVKITQTSFPSSCPLIDTHTHFIIRSALKKSKTIFPSVYITEQEFIEILIKFLSLEKYFSYELFPLVRHFL